jgi:hypothetical protein
MILFFENLVLFEVRFFKESKFEADNILQLAVITIQTTTYTSNLFISRVTDFICFIFEDGNWSLPIMQFGTLGERFDSSRLNAFLPLSQQRCKNAQTSICTLFF